MTTTLTSPQPSTSQIMDGAISRKPRSKSQTRKRKTLARARRPRGAFDSDEDVEQAALTDSDSDVSSGGSFTDHSVSEEDEEDEVAPNPIHINGQSVAQQGLQAARSSSPSSPGPVYDSHSDKPNGESKPLNTTPLLSGPIDWSEMVQEQIANGITDLPVIDFGDFSSGKDILSAPLPPIEEKPATTDHPNQSELPTSPPPPPIESTTMRTKPPPRQSARQAYQRRLSEDPSYVPVVGDFWGHDDRLMDKDLRSLSGWWRGRWQGRGRGFLGRGWGGRGGPVGSFTRHIRTPLGSEEVNGLQNQQPADQDIQPSEKPWVHDGFEQMKRREEEQRLPRYPYQRGRGRGRGGFVAPVRSRAASSAQSRPISPFNPTAHAHAQAIAQGRPWYVKKPERTWTKQFDAFLYADTDSKSRGGLGLGIRVRLTSGPVFIVRMPIVDGLSEESQRPASPARTESDKSYVVKLPPKEVSWAGKTGTRPVAYLPESVTTIDEFSLDPLSLQNPSPSTHIASNPAFSNEGVAPPSNQAQQFQSQTQSAPEPTSPLAAVMDTFSSSDHAVNVAPFSNPDATGSGENSAIPGQDLQGGVGMNAPSPYPLSPSYNSPYGYSSGLPPGIVYNGNGYPVDITTGHPVYLQPAMTPMYNPQSLMHPHMISPELMSYGPMGSDYMSSPAYHDFQFALPRQSSRVEIRAPKDEEDGRPRQTRPSSDLRSSLKAEPFRPSSVSPYYLATDNSPTMQAVAFNDSVMSPNGDGSAHPILYQGMQYYIPPYPYQPYVDPNQQYEGYSDGQQVYYPPLSG